MPREGFEEVEPRPVRADDRRGGAAIAARSPVLFPGAEADDEGLDSEGVEAFSPEPFV